MTVKNFKVGQGLDLDGLVLTNGNGELLVNGNAIAVDLTGYATESYVGNALVDYTPTLAMANALADFSTIVTNQAGTALNVNTDVIATRDHVANALTPYATEVYVANAIANSTVDLAPAAGNYIDWNVNTEAFDLDFYTVANALAGDGLVYQNGQLAAKTGGIIDGNSTYIPVTKDGSGNLAIFDNAVTDRLAGNGLISAKSSGLYHFDIDYATVSTTLVNSYNIAQSNALPTYTTANVLAGTGLNVGYNNYYNSYSIDVDTNYIATVDHVANSISNLVGLAPTTLDTLQELSTALQDNPNVITSLQSIASGKQNALIEGFAIDIYGNTIAVDSAAIANAIAGSGITYSNGQLTAAPGYISTVDASFAVTNGELSLSDAITISSVELKDSVANVTAASDVFGNGSVSTYSMGSAVTIGTLPTGAEVADVFVTLKAAVGASTFSRTSKLTYVNTGGDAPTWTEYGIIVSGSFPATTISFDSSGNIIANVTGSDAYSAKGVATILK